LTGVLASSISLASLKIQEGSLIPLLVLFKEDPLRWALL